MTIINNTTITTNYNANASLYTLTKAKSIIILPELNLHSGHIAKLLC